MNNAQSNSATDSHDPATTGARPEKSFRQDDVIVSVWANSTQRNGQTVSYHKTTITKFYQKPGEDRPKRTSSFDAQDLHKIRDLLQQADDYLKTKSAS